jgi:hypothetical protein
MKNRTENHDNPDQPIGAIDIQSIAVASFRGRGDFEDVTWRTVSEALQPPADAGGTEAAQLMIRLNVDEQFDCVYADLRGEVDVHVLNRSIAALTRIRNGLLDAYKQRPAFGQCLQESGLGRCLVEWDHDGDHAFPTNAGDAR